MFIKLLFYSIFTALLLLGCRQVATKDLIIENSKKFDSIPSASGIVVLKDTAYIVTDDGTGIYTIDINTFSTTKIPIKGFDYQLYREDKSTKHDFEGACLIKWKGKDYLLAIGSGSNEKSRDSLLMLNIADHSEQHIISLRLFYNQLQKLTSTQPQQWNIEGISAAGTQLILINRGNNLMIECNTTIFLDWLFNSNKPFPKIEYQQLHLPSIYKHEARLSGICTIDDTHLLFCASVEDTPDWTKDGPVLGSYFGIYSMEKKQIIATYLLHDREDHPMKEKIESVEIVEKGENGLVFLATGDNDNGSSTLFRIKLNNSTLR